ncbi:MAG: PDR/VanB family oxidoreductase [Pseudomonadota bacterium]
MNQLNVRVTAKTKETNDIYCLELAAVDGKPLPPFSAGSHVDILIKEGLVRQYSLCNDPSEQHRYQIGVLRDPHSRGGSIAVHDGIHEGDIIQISEPKNHFAMVPAKRTLLFAGGIGVTPILCMAERLAATGAPFEMHYCARSEDHAAFRSRITRSAFADRVHFHFDNGPEQQKMDLPALLAAPEADTHLYVCGPGGFIDFVVNTASAAGWDAAHVHLEYFGAQALDTSQDGAFDIQIASSGKVLRIPADKSVTAVLAEHGIEVPVSCEQGVCGTCVTRVLSGTPEHRDLYFTADEQAGNDQFTPCCSRSKSPCLVLDL